MNHQPREVLYLRADEDHLSFFQALANRNRLEILKILCTREASIKELSGQLSLSSAIITKHVQALEEAGIVTSITRPGRRGLSKICSLAVNEAQIIFNNNYEKTSRSFVEEEIPISAYREHEVTAPCGMASEDRIFGAIDDPRYFAACNRYAVSLLWFSSGYVTYPVPLMDVDLDRVEEIAITLELCSEHPGFNNSWKSDITFSMDGLCLGTWTSPGDFGDRKGRFTPVWWTLGTEYGLRKTLSISQEGTFMDSIRIGDTTLAAILENRKRPDELSFTIAADADAPHPGGLNLFGRHFGDYGQNIRVCFYYRNTETEGRPEENGE